MHYKISLQLQTVRLHGVKIHKRGNYLSDLNSIVQDPLLNATVHNDKRYYTCRAGSRTQGHH